MGFSPEARRGSQGASRAAPGKSGLHARGEGERVLALAGASRGFSPAAVPVGVFSRDTTRISGSLPCGGVGCHFLLQGIFPTQGTNPGLTHCRRILYHLNPGLCPSEKLLAAPRRIPPQAWAVGRAPRGSLLLPLTLHPLPWNAGGSGQEAEPPRILQDQQRGGQTPGLQQDHGLDVPGCVLGIPCGHLDSSVHPRERPEARNGHGGPNALTEQIKPESMCVLGVRMSSSGPGLSSQPGLSLNPDAVAYAPTTNAKETEQFSDDLQDLLELTP